MEREEEIRSRADIENDIAGKEELIKQLESEIIELKKESMLLSDEHQRFTEKEEEVVISRRPKKTEKRLIGRIHWKQWFLDDDTGEKFCIDRSCVVRVNGEWQ